MSATTTRTDAAPGKPGGRVVIFDTTLRDGEQSPGASMNLDEKIKIALLLEEIRAAGSSVCTVRPVTVARRPVKAKGRRFRVCPSCGESYPESHGERCFGCQGADPYGPAEDPLWEALEEP